MLIILIGLFGVSKKWILYIGGFELPDRNAAAQRVMGNAKVFRDLGYDTFFVGLSRKINLCSVIGEYEGFKYVNLFYPESTKDWISYLSCIEQYKKYLEKQPDILIVYNFPAIPLNKLYKYCIRKNIKIIGDCTEWYEAHGDLTFRLIKRADTNFRMKKIHLKLDGMIAISQYLYEYYKGRMKNVIIIPPLVDITMNKWEDNKEDLSIQNEDLLKIIYAGSPGTGNKERIDLILDILSRIKNLEITNFEFMVIGITQNQFCNNFGTEVPKNLMSNVIFKGRLSHIDTLNEIKKAHLYLFLRDNNLTNNAGFPTKFVESISCGTPVLTNSTSNIKAFLIEGRNGFILDNSTEKTLEKSLLRVMNLPYEKIVEMKKFCLASRTFHYFNFILDFKLLFQSIYSN